MRILILLLALLPAGALADLDDWRLGTINASYHSSGERNDGQPYNERHDGLCVTYTVVVSCSYKNSYERRSYILGYKQGSWAAVEILEATVEIGSTFAYVTGYDNTNVFATIDFHIGYVQFSFAPGELVDETNVVAVGLDISLDELEKLMRF